MKEKSLEKVRGGSQVGPCKINIRGKGKVGSYVGLKVSVASVRPWINATGVKG